MTGILGNVGGSQPDVASSVNLAPWNPGGFGSIAPLPLPQLQDTSAAFLPSSAFVPSRPLYDPTPFAPGELTMDRAAMAPPFNLTSGQLANIRNGAEAQTLVSGLAGLARGPVVGFALPEAGVPDLVAHAIGAGIDLEDQFDLARRLQTAPDQAVYKYMNDIMNQNLQAQNVPPAWRAFP